MTSGIAASRVFRTASGTVALVVVAAIAVIFLGDAVLRAGWGEMLLIAPWLLLIVWGAYVSGFASTIRTDAAGATVQNLLRRTRVPWAAVTDIVLRYQVAFVLDDGREVRAFGGPMLGRPGRLDAAASATSPRHVPAPLRQLELIRAPWQAADAAAPHGDLTHSWDVPAIVVFGVLAAWAACAVALAHAA